MRLLLITLLLSCASSTFAGEEGDWIYLRADYTHDPYTGQRVTQFAESPTAYYNHSPDYQKSGYRYSNSTLRVGNSTDRHTVVETWGNGALAMGSTMLWQPYDDRGNEGYDRYSNRRHRRKVHEDRHKVHRKFGGHGSGTGDMDHDDDGDHAKPEPYHGDDYGDRGRRRRGGYGGNGFGYPVYGYPAFGGGYSESGFAGDRGRIQWDENSKAGSIEWDRDVGFQRSGYGFGGYGYAAPYNGRHGGRGGSRPHSGGGNSRGPSRMQF